MRKILFLYFLLFSFIAQEAPISQLCLNACETEVAKEVENTKKAEEFLSQEKIRVGRRPSNTSDQRFASEFAGLQSSFADQSHQIPFSVRKHLYHMQFLI